ncbi:MAG: Lrp/AsnC family transcriptional regulator [Kiritimatiellae bacterium]|nr:Lrp/AsnC family transcriptional regulator [Kiritimatiellia bacterium]
MDELLNILKTNALETPENLAKMLNQTEEEIKAKIAEYEKNGVIRGYQAVINEDQLDTHYVTAVIEVKITPQREGGFDHIAKRISKFSEVQSVYLMSGAFDLLLFVTDKDLKNVASFVSEKLATINGVISTATHFMLKPYKNHGILMESHDEYERLKVSP